MKEKIFITTTLPYANSGPHMGHAIEFILADVIARYLRQANPGTIDPVLFNVGLDEHGSKIWQTAKDRGLSVELHLEHITMLWKDFCEKFNISYDNFYKTSTPEHHTWVRTLWSEINEVDMFSQYPDLIYSKRYDGMYCKGCESFKTDKDLVDGKCPDHSNLELEHISEENYFFRLSAFKEMLLRWLEDNPNFLKPSNKLPELVNMIDGIEDISISRRTENCPWGVTVPGDIHQKVYVWFDALLNYIVAAGISIGSKPGARVQVNNWEKTIQICGPDNLRFQGIIFQSMLMALNVPNTKTLLVHGMVLDKDGKKMSKTVGNIVNPIEQLFKYGIDAVRYYAVGILNNYSDVRWKESDLVANFNADICEGFGNLVSRVMHLIEKNYSKDMPTGLEIDKRFTVELNKHVLRTMAAYDKYSINEACDELREFVKFGNLYINEHKPWTQSGDDFHRTMSNLYDLIWNINELYYPIFPDTCDMISSFMQAKKKVIAFKKIEIC